jgi:two-component system, OmpR family, phosphate regulon response regulator PhoB
MTARILIVEDEPDMARVLQYNLRQAGYQTAVSETGSEALEAVRQAPPDLILLDWMLPDLPGTEVCRQLRRGSDAPGTPIIMVSARGEEIDRVVGFEIGVDDYVVKPFSVRELLLRVGAILARRTAPEPTEALAELGPLRLDLEGYRIFVSGEEVGLTDLETQLLRVLAAARDRVVRREDLLREVWGPDNAVTTAAVDSHVKRLRTKLGDAGRYLQTVRGVGYTLSTAERAGSR